MLRFWKALVPNMKLWPVCRTTFLSWASRFGLTVWDCLWKRAERAASFVLWLYISAKAFLVALSLPFSAFSASSSSLLSLWTDRRVYSCKSCIATLVLISTSPFGFFLRGLVTLARIGEVFSERVNISTCHIKSKWLLCFTKEKGMPSTLCSVI